MDNILIVATTFETKEEAHNMAKALLKERLVACAQISNEIESIYWWKDEIVTSAEYILTLKTKEDLYRQLESFIKKSHSYDTPEIIAVPTTHVDSDYYKWLCEEVRPEDK